MAIYAIGAYHGRDVSEEFIENGIVGPGWPEQDAPELQQYIASLKAGDIIYIKSCSPRSRFIFVKAIGFISDHLLLTKKADTKEIVSAGRNVKWVVTDEFKIRKPKEKNNVRLNTLYEEFHPDVQKAILEKLFSKMG